MYIVYSWPHSYIPPYASNIELVAYAFVGMACLESTWHLLSDQGPLWECMVSALVWVYWGAPGDTVKSAFGRRSRNRLSSATASPSQVRPDGQQVHKL